MYTKSDVWTGKELSEHFETKYGVKQGCLQSPVLFSLYLNDLHECLEGGLFIDEMNIRILMYADDIVLLADDVGTMQQMINHLAKYIYIWGMMVNQTKSEIMMFRKGGRLAESEKWTYNGEWFRTVNEYQYLGMTLTPRLSFTKHIERKTNASKTCGNIL